MKILILLAHPNPGSFNHAIARTAEETLARMGHDVILHDLHAEGFDPLLPAEEIQADADLPDDIAQHCRELRAAEGIIIVHPNWWGMPPAVLKGWVDRVVRPKVAYAFAEDDSGEGVPVGLLNARTAVVINTANTPDQREQEVFGDPLETLWRNCVLGLCGVPDVRRRTFGIICTSTAEERLTWLEEVRELAREAFP